MDRYDTFSRRFNAGLIDGLIFVPITLLDYWIVDNGNTVALTLWLIFSYSIFYIYTVYFHWSTGQTLGKKWMDVRVVDKSETRLLSFRQAFMRDSVYIVLETIGLIILVSRIEQLEQYSFGESAIEIYLDWLVIFWFLLETLTMLTNERRRAIHDILAGSVVVRDEFWRGRAG